MTVSGVAVGLVSPARRSISWAMLINLIISPIFTAIVYRSELIEAKLARYIGKRLAFIIYVTFSVVLVTVDEFLVAIANCKARAELSDISTSDKPFDELLPTVQAKITDYYNELCKHNSRRLMVIAREASIQLILQNAMLRALQVTLINQ